MIGPKKHQKKKEKGPSLQVNYQIDNTLYLPTEESFLRMEPEPIKGRARNSERSLVVGGMAKSPAKARKALDRSGVGSQSMAVLGQSERALGRLGKASVALEMAPGRSEKTPEAGSQSMIERISTRGRTIFPKKHYEN